MVSSEKAMIFSETTCSALFYSKNVFLYAKHTVITVDPCQSITIDIVYFEVVHLLEDIFSLWSIIFTDHNLIAETTQLKKKPQNQL